MVEVQVLVKCVDGKFTVATVVSKYADANQMELNSAYDLAGKIGDWTKAQAEKAGSPLNRNVILDERNLY